MTQCESHDFEQPLAAGPVASLPASTRTPPAVTPTVRSSALSPPWMTSVPLENVTEGSARAGAAAHAVTSAQATSATRKRGNGGTLPPSARRGRSLSLGQALFELVDDPH